MWSLDGATRTSIYNDNGAKESKLSVPREPSAMAQWDFPRFLPYAIGPLDRKSLHHGFAARLQRSRRTGSDRRVGVA